MVYIVFFFFYGGRVFVFCLIFVSSVSLLRAI